MHPLPQVEILKKAGLLGYRRQGLQAFLKTFYYLRFTLFIRRIGQFAEGVEQHFPLVSRRFNVYAGGGLHKGWVTRDGTEEDPIYKDPFGLSLIAGIEASLGRLNVSYDFKPAINLSGGKHTIYSQTGVSLRYVIVKRPWLNDPKAKRKRQRERERRRNKNGDGFNWKFWENW